MENQNYQGKSSDYFSGSSIVLPNLQKDSGLEILAWNDGSGWSDGCWSDGGGWENSSWSNSGAATEKYVTPERKEY